MNTECTPEPMEFHVLGRREVIGKFDGGKISSDGGSLLLREVENRAHILKRLSTCFEDHRKADLIEHSVESLIKQRVYGIALGYEDLNDHDRLRHDDLLAVLCDKSDPTGAHRHQEPDQGKALAGKSTLNRLELTPEEADEHSRYKKIVADPQAMDRLLVDLFVESYEHPPHQIVLDLDATDDPVHGEQEGRFFHGYYRCYCYLPLYIFCGEHLLCARLRKADQDGAAGALEEVSRIAHQLWAVWPKVRILIRGDAGFCRNPLMSWCESDERLDYVLGLAQNSRLKQAIAEELAQAKQIFERTEEPVRLFKDFRYQTLDSWDVERRVIGKAEHLEKGENPRFIVSSLAIDEIDDQRLYEDVYCARGDMENRIKEQQLDMFADRTSTSMMRSNQLRLYLSSFAYVLMQTLRRLGLAGTELARAQCQTIRLKLFKIGAQIRVSVRKVWISLSESYPYAELYQQIYLQLQRIPLRC